MSKGFASQKRAELLLDELRQADVVGPPGGFSEKRLQMLGITT